MFKKPLQTFGLPEKLTQMKNKLAIQLFNFFDSPQAASFGFSLPIDLSSTSRCTKLMPV